jgi:hypothetical protein
MISRILVGVLLALVAAEIVARRVYYVQLDNDPTFGSIIRPGTTARFAREGVGWSRWTDHGLRHATPPDPSHPAILALGDSYTEALGIDDPDVFTHRLEAATHLQVLNAGRAGASVADYIALAPTYRALYKPVWTVVQLREKDLTTDAWDKRKEGWAYFEGGVGAPLTIVPATIEPRGHLWHLVDPLRRHLALFSFAIIRFREFRAAAEAEPPLFLAGDAHKAPSTDGNAVLPQAEAQRYPVARELELLNAAYQNRVTVLYLPDFDPKAPERVDSFVEETFDRLCRERGWSCVNLRRSYADFAARHRAPFGFPNSGYNFGHMNADGHAAAAAALARELAGRLRDLL